LSKRGKGKGRIRKRRGEGKGKGKGKEGKERGKEKTSRKNTENRDFYQICQLWGLLYPPPSHIWAKFGV